MELDRRELIIKALSVTGFIAVGSGSVISQVIKTMNLPASMQKEAELGYLLGKNLPYSLETTEEIGNIDLEVSAQSDPHKASSIADKSKNFEQVFEDDYFFDAKKMEILKRAHEKLHQIQQHVGYSNFNLLNMDEAFAIAKSVGAIDAFSLAEKEILEELFATDAKKYGFYGKRVQNEFTPKKISRKDVDRIPKTGHFLYKDVANDFYTRLIKDVGPSLVLTSGIRTLAKQSYLFSTKILQSQGNLSKASRSVAPPGYSYHAIGDFDVGKVGFGYRNFTAEFANTKEYKSIKKLTYVNIRYERENQFGVRYEPWHITTTTT